MNKYWSKNSNWDFLYEAERKQDNLMLLGKDSPYYEEHLIELRRSAKIKHSDKRRIKEIEDSLNPCPVCLSTKVKIITSVQYGHGDSTFSASVKCTSCGIIKPCAGGYGNELSIQDYEKVLQEWNNLKNNSNVHE